MRTALFLYLLAAAGFLLAVCFSCGSRREVVNRQRVDSVAVTAVKADHVATAAASWEFIREIVVLQADSVGELRPVLHVVEKSQGNTEEKTAENVQKTDSAAFSVKSEVITKETTEKPLEVKKTRFWRNAFFWLFGLAATVVGVVTLWRKTIAKWI
jgi:hypothetical protein